MSRPSSKDAHGDRRSQASQLIVVSGAPGTGKTSLATQLSQELGLPVVHRDTIKEALFDTIGTSNRDDSHELGRAAYRVLYDVARKILESGTGVILESNFVRGISEPDLAGVAAGRDARLVHCVATREAIVHRIQSRPGRHPQHSDAVEEVVKALDAHVYDPVDLAIPVLVVETSDGFEPDLREVVGFCHRPLG